jgi:putative Mg2+ transporter-C (MgtC) family protein
MAPQLFDYSILYRLAAAVLLGGIIGLERSGANHDAGLRTHSVLCLGAATVAVVSECLVKQYGIPGEIMRMNAQVVSGVGFLGMAGVIAEGSRVRGLTTAAGLWTTACVGLAVGAGYYIIAALVVALMMCALLGLRSLARRLGGKRAKSVGIRIEFQEMEQTKSVIRALIEEKAHIHSARFTENGGKLEMEIEAGLPRGRGAEGLMYRLSEFGGIREFSEL